MDYAKLPLEIAWGRATLNPTAVSESKVVHQPVWVKVNRVRLSFRNRLPEHERLVMCGLVVGRLI